ncbi:MAG TPA: metallophosphoesterase family protein [Polyangiaceae bacterium]|nr:metallophosphoesterase family protein [Polyangiaceae bacterium]
MLPGDPRRSHPEAGDGDGAKPLVRLGLIGDVHAEDEALKIVLDDFERRGVDAILCVGDLADGSGDVNRTCALLEEHRVLTVAGNHDRWLLSDEQRDKPGATSARSLTERTRTFLDRLPTTLKLQTAYGRLLLCHGVGDDDLACVKPDHLRHDLERNDALKRVLAGPPFELMVNGHTHRAMVRRVRHLTIVNAGTLHRNDERRALILDAAALNVTFFDVRPTGLDEIERVALPDVDEWSRV